MYPPNITESNRKLRIYFDNKQNLKIYQIMNKIKVKNRTYLKVHRQNRWTEKFMTSDEIK